MRGGFCSCGQHSGLQRRKRRIHVLLNRLRQRGIDFPESLQCSMHPWPLSLGECTYHSLWFWVSGRRNTCVPASRFALGHFHTPDRILAARLHSRWGRRRCSKPFWTHLHFLRGHGQSSPLASCLSKTSLHEGHSFFCFGIGHVFLYFQCDSDLCFFPM